MYIKSAVLSAYCLLALHNGTGPPSTTLAHYYEQCWWGGIWQWAKVQQNQLRGNHVGFLDIECLVFIDGKSPVRLSETLPMLTVLASLASIPNYSLIGMIFPKTHNYLVLHISRSNSTEYYLIRKPFNKMMSHFLICLTKHCLLICSLSHHIYLSWKYCAYFYPII